MGIRAGALRELSIDHPEFGQRVFEPKVGEDHNTQIGGFKVNDDDGNFTSGGQMIIQSDAYPWSINPTIGANDGDHKFLQDCQSSGVEGQWNAVYANAETRTGQGIPVGDIELNQNAGTIGFTVKGSGEFETI